MKDLWKKSHRKQGRTRRRIILGITGLKLVPRPKGGTLDGMEHQGHNLYAFNGYQELKPDAPGETFPDLAGKLSGLESSVVLISNPDLRVVGFVERAHPQYVALAMHHLISFGSHHLSVVNYNLGDFKQLQVLRAKPP